LLHGLPVEYPKTITVSKYKNCRTFSVVVVYLWVNIFVTLGYQHIWS